MPDDPEEIVQVYLAYRPHEAHFLCNVLADAGIDARVLGEPLNMVDPPVNLQSGTVWVRRRDADQARQILARWEQERAQSHPDSEVATTWTCPSCGELVEGNFDVCWNCQTSRQPLGT